MAFPISPHYLESWFQGQGFCLSKAIRRFRESVGREFFENNSIGRCSENKQSIVWTERTKNSNIDFCSSSKFADFTDSFDKETGYRFNVMCQHDSTNNPKCTEVSFIEKESYFFNRPAVIFRRNISFSD